jgi:hypothetical protein
MNTHHARVRAIHARHAGSGVRRRIAVELAGLAALQAVTAWPAAAGAATLDAVSA